MYQVLISATLNYPMSHFTNTLFMKLIASIILLCTLSIAVSAQNSQSVPKDHPALPERIDLNTLHQDSLTVERKSTPSKAEIIAVPTDDSIPREIKHDSTVRERRTQKEEK